MSGKVVLISMAGCDLYPHGTLHKVLEVKQGVYPTLDERDRINSSWCTEVDKAHLIDWSIIDADGFAHELASTLFGTHTILTGVSINGFRRRGYYQDNTRTGFFTQEEYREYECYMELNQLEYTP